MKQLMYAFQLLSFPRKISNRLNTSKTKTEVRFDGVQGELYQRLNSLKLVIASRNKLSDSRIGLEPGFLQKKLFQGQQGA